MYPAQLAGVIIGGVIVLKQVALHGQRLELHYSPETRTWCSKVADVLTLKRRKEETERHLRRIGSTIYMRRVNDNFGTFPEDYLEVHLR